MLSQETKEIIDGIKAFVSECFGSTSDEIFNGRSRSYSDKMPRFAAYFLLEKTGVMNTSQIGRVFGYHHTTVKNGIEQVKLAGLDGELMKRFRMEKISKHPLLKP